MKTVFLLGCWSSINEKQTELLNTLKVSLTRKNLTVVSCLDFLPLSVEKNTVQKLMLSKMLACDTVITMPDWYENKEASEAIHLARTVNIKVESAINHGLYHNVSA